MNAPLRSRWARSAWCARCPRSAQCAPFRGIGGLPRKGSRHFPEIARILPRGGAQRGAASIELAVLTPAVIAFFAAVVIAGRITLALQAADSAAYDAARTASLARSAAEAQTEARSAALASFSSQGITCLTLTVTVNTAGFSVPVGQSATVSVNVSCLAELRDVALPGMPGSTTLTSSFVSPLDRYRSRT